MGGGAFSLDFFLCFNVSLMETCELLLGCFDLRAKWTNKQGTQTLVCDTLL